MSHLVSNSRAEQILRVIRRNENSFRPLVVSENFTTALFIFILPPTGKLSKNFIDKTNRDDIPIPEGRKERFLLDENFQGTATLLRNEYEIGTCKKFGSSRASENFYYRKVFPLRTACLGELILRGQSSRTLLQLLSAASTTKIN